MNLFSLLQGNFIRSKRTCFRIFLFAICNLQFVICNSQTFLGYINSEYAGVNGIDLNPACIVNSPRNWDVSIIGLNFQVANNFLGFQKRALDHSGGMISGNYPAFNDNNFATNYFTKRSRIKSISVFAAANISLPSFMFTRKKHKDAFAFTCRTRAYVNADGISPAVANMLVTGASDSSLYNQMMNAKKISVQAMAWNEYGITYGKTYRETSNERLNVAGRLKFVQGLAAAYGYVKNINYTSLVVNGKAGYGYSSNLDNPITLSSLFSRMPSLGLDIGATYEFHPLTDVHTKMTSQSKTTPMQHKYKYKIGFSIQDIGWITYLTSPNSRAFAADNTLIKLNSVSTASLDNAFTETDGGNKFRMMLPTTANITGDYYAGKNIFLNSTLYDAFQFSYLDHKIHEITTFSITPRWDWKWIGTYFPVSYDKYSHLRVGASIRLGPLVIGTANFLPLVTKKDVYGLDFHFLLKVPHIAFNKKNTKPRNASRYNVNQERNKKPEKEKRPSDMPKKDTTNYKQPKPEKENKSKKENTPAKREKKPRKHIFPRLHLFKKKNRHVSPEDREHTIYFKM